MQPFLIVGDPVVPSPIAVHLRGAGVAHHVEVEIAASVGPGDRRGKAAAPLALVFSDDEEMRGLIVKLLERRGYDVRQAASADAALAQSHLQRPAVVVCAASVPGMSGLALYEALAATPPAPHFVLIAGDKRAAATHAGVRVLEKPFTATDLEAALADAGVAARRAG